MKKITILMIALLAVACSSQQKSADENSNTNSPTSVKKEFVAVMKIKNTIRKGEPVELSFKVYNQTDSVSKFLKWQTPFEPLLAKYLDIKDQQGEEVNYKGAMAKRMMPPPADAYISVNPNDSLTAVVDILKGYALEKPGKYTISFNSSELNGLKVPGTISFIYQQD